MVGRCWMVAVILFGSALGTGAQVRRGIESQSKSWEALKWRAVGPAAMGGRVTGLAVEPGNASVFYVATATGGLLRSRNCGTTLEAVFEAQGSSSIGAVAVAPSKPGCVWVGTGEGNARNSASWGDGVYKSLDGGDHWERMGLEKTRHIGRIAIHPKDSRIVFVAAVGRFWGPNPERGLYRTKDGGESWELVLGLDSNTGCIDVVIDPKSPDTIFAASYEVRRDAFDGNDPARRFGVQSGIWKSQDGGDSWKRLSTGLPSVKLGRCSLALWPEDPKLLYALIETEFIGKRAPGRRKAVKGPAYLGVRGGNGGKPKLAEVLRGTPAAKAGLEAGDLLLEMDGKKLRSYDDLVDVIRAHRAGDEVELSYRRGESTHEAKLRFGSRNALGHSAYLGGQKENVQDRQGPQGFQCGGVFRSEDGGESWQRVNSLNPRPFYFSQIRIDPNDSKRISVLGIQLHISDDGGETFKNDGAPGIHVDHHALWIDPADSRHLLLGNDGGLHCSWDRGRSWEQLALVGLAQYYAVAVDQSQPYRIFGGLQDNGTWVIPSRTRQPALVNDHARKIGGGDGFVCAVDPRDDDLVYSESQNGGIQRRHLVSGARARILPPGGMGRFNWRTPFFLSPHNASTFYFGGTRVYRSRQKGAEARAISERLPLTPRGSLTAVAESPRAEGVLWAGSDDGALWVSRDDGESWGAIHDNLPLPGPRWVACIEPSRSRRGMAYVVLDGHRSDDLEPWVFVTRNYGKSFKRIGKGQLPPVSARVLREDPHNHNLLYLGNELGVWASLDRGRSWFRLGAGLPTVPVHDLVVQMRDRELIAGTHGRGAYILDVEALEAGERKMAGLEFLAVEDVILWDRRPSNGRFGHRRFRVATPRIEAVGWIWVKPEEKERQKGDEAKGAEKLRVAFEALDGRVLHETSRVPKPGLNRVRWSLREKGKGRRPGPRIPPGRYRVRIERGKVEKLKTFAVRLDPARGGKEERP